jgi:plastocyanin
MHTLAVQLAPVLAAEKSHVPFYIAGGLLIAWALILSLVLGRNGDFPKDKSGERGVIAITALLVIAAAGTAVITAGGPAKATASTTSTSAVTPQTPAPAAPATSSSPSTAAPAPAAPATAATSLKLAADPNNTLAFDTKTLSAKAGKITITMANASQLEHNLTIAQGSTVIGATPTFAGGTKTVTVTLKPGKYTFYCSVPGHRQAGMEGTLTVS